MFYYLKKAGSLLVTLIMVSLITFGVFQVLPGNPVDIILGVDADPAQAEALTKSMGLDKPLAERYLAWAEKAAHGDLGSSTRFQRPVAELIKSRVEVTITLAAFSLFLTLVIGIPAGIWLAKTNNTKRGVFVSVCTQLGLAIPSFWLGILLILFFAVTLHVFPAGGYVPWRQNVLLCIMSLFLPAVSIAVGTSAVLIRYLKNTLLEQIRLDYVRTAYSKGLTQNRVLVRHVLRNALIPVVTILGMLAVDILGGSIITESVFSLPGIGNLIVLSIASRDLPLIQGLVLYLAIIVVACNFLVDLLYAVIDPRIRLK